MAVFAASALVLDTLSRAPTMDILSIVNLLLQYIAAGGITAFSTSVFEISGRHYMKARNRQKSAMG
jgi:hypothetical protein